ncbi:MAG: 4-(cytidine 5'-diphospho)-2-C-methyl-D-erythritol kinase [Thermonemataceae bacterium]
MLCFPNAKINIGLQVTKKRPDGFHNLLSAFYPVGWCDILEILPADAWHFTNTGISIPDIGENNLCLKAYQLLQNDFDLPPVQIHLHKIIPIGAGLGGGSSDAAFTLKSLNTIFNLNLTTAQLEQYARQLGSDCAFFVQNQPRYCYEKGDQFEALPLHLKDFYIVIVYPNLHISTKEAYSSIRPKAPTFDLKEMLKQQDFDKWRSTVENDFEPALFNKYPALSAIKQKLYDDYGACYVAMTGSGSAIYGIFDQEVAVRFPQEYLTWQGKLN